MINRGRTKSSIWCCFGCDASIIRGGHSKYACLVDVSGQWGLAVGSEEYLGFKSSLPVLYAAIILACNLSFQISIQLTHYNWPKCIGMGSVPRFSASTTTWNCSCRCSRVHSKAKSQELPWRGGHQQRPSWTWWRRSWEGSRPGTPSTQGQGS